MPRAPRTSRRCRPSPAASCPVAECLLQAGEVRTCLGIAAAAALSAPPPATTGAGSHAGIAMHWTIDGVQRDAIVFAPLTTSGAVRPAVVFAFHGHGGNARRAARRMHLQSVWPQAVVVYPQGLDSPTPLDPSGLQPGWQLKSGDSNGAIFGYLLWAERAKTIAAVGSVSGLLDASETLTVPRALIAFSGKQDEVSPFSVQMQSVERARQVDHATGSGVPAGKAARSMRRRAGTRPPSRRSCTPAATSILRGRRFRSSGSSRPTRSRRARAYRAGDSVSCSAATASAPISSPHWGQPMPSARWSRNSPHTGHSRLARRRTAISS
jgi:polyhydroxybutyrate depolymerase